MTPHPELELLLEEGFPLVLMDRRVDGMRCDSVVVDNQDGAKRLVGELVDIGAGTIAVACGPDDTWTGAERMKGFTAGIEGAGLTLPDELVYTGPYDKETGRRAARCFLESGARPDAVVAANNLILEGVLEVLMEKGAGGEGIAVGAFDGVPFAGLMNRPIVVAKQPRREIGRRAARLLIERIEETAGDAPREEVLPVRITRTGADHGKS
jgi:DNA-binding LacI/PurR family transcriptional regulator